MQSKDYELLVIRGQPFYHEPATIIGNKLGLIALRNIIDKALQENESIIEGEFLPPDGESFGVAIVINDNDWQDPSWQEEKNWYHIKRNSDE